MSQLGVARLTYGGTYEKTMLFACSLTTMIALQGAAGRTFAEETAAAAKPEDTEQWEPVPRKVPPGVDGRAAPSDAIVLFDGRNLDEWVMAKDRSPARWRVDGRAMVVDKAFGSIETKRLFKNYQLHLEWRIPADVTGEGQARRNSGLFLASTGTEDQGDEVQFSSSGKTRRM